jgi:hypothetical protein
VVDSGAIQRHKVDAPRASIGNRELNVTCRSQFPEFSRRDFECSEPRPDINGHGIRPQSLDHPCDLLQPVGGVDMVALHDANDLVKQRQLSHTYGEVADHVKVVGHHGHQVSIKDGNSRF